MADQSIESIDQNFRIETKLGESDLVWRDARLEPFQGYGLYRFREESGFRRMPAAIAAQISDSVGWLNSHTAGGRIRFISDSRYVAIHANMPGVTRFPHMTLAGSSGFDLYVEEDGTSRYCGTYMPPVDMKDGYESILYFPDRRRRSFLIHFPLYNSVDFLAVGLQEGAFLGESEPYRISQPVLFYGSSITQGGCASRPGNCYPAILSRLLNCDHWNLGFSGSALGEKGMAEYVAGLDLSAFVCDYDHNAPDRRHLAETLPAFFRIFRQSQPDTPVLLISKPDFDADPAANGLRREVVRSVWEQARKKGDRHVYFVDGETLFQVRFRDCCTVDTVHPNDLGFVRMADTIVPVLCQALQERES